MVERDGLENRYRGNPIESSNLSSSAKSPHVADFFAVRQARADSGNRTVKIRKSPEFTSRLFRTLLKNKRNKATIW